MMISSMERFRDLNWLMERSAQAILPKSVMGEVRGSTNFSSWGIAYIRGKGSSLKKIYAFLSILALVSLFSPSASVYYKEHFKVGLYEVEIASSPILMFLVAWVSLCVGLILGFKIKTLGSAKAMGKPGSNRRYDPRKMEELWNWYNREEP